MNVLVSCERCSADYSITQRTLRRPDRRQQQRLCKSCRSLKGLRNGAHINFTPAATPLERKRARGLVNKRRQLGWFTPPPACQKCGEAKRLDSHHPDYSKPDEVVWLCRSCHMKAHRDATFLDGVEPVRVTDERGKAGAA